MSLTNENPPSTCTKSQSDNDGCGRRRVSSSSLGLLLDYPVLVQHEERMIKTPYDVSGWWTYLTTLDDWLLQVKDWAMLKNQQKMMVMGDATVRVGDHLVIQRNLTRIRRFVGQRAVQLLPGSYKIWRSHLAFQVQCHYRSHTHAHAYSNSISTSSFQRVQDSFEDCFKRLHKMPRLWMDYLQFMSSTRPPAHLTDITAWRRLVNRALMSVPVTQHAKLWTVILPVLEPNPNDAPSLDPTAVHIVPTTLVRNDNDNNNIVTGRQRIPTETIIRMLRRYCMLDPTYRTTFAQSCVSVWHRPAEAALVYLDLINDAETLTTQKYDLWIAFSDLACQYALPCRQVGINFEVLVKSALYPPTRRRQQQQQQGGGGGGNAGMEEIHEITKDDDDNDPSTPTATTNARLNLGEMEGTLWAKLANYYVRLGEFDMARSIYEEAMDAVSRVRDFAILFDAYSQLEEGILEAAMTFADGGDDDVDEGNDNQGDAKKNEDGNEQDNEKNRDENVGDDDDDDDDDDWDILLGSDADKTKGSPVDMEWAISRAEHLAARRPLLLNRVLLKQNPHNVGEWLTRSQLNMKQGHVGMAVATLQESLKQVHANKAVNGAPSQLVLELVRLYEEELREVDKARQAFESICQKWDYRFRHVEDMAICYSSWVELELRHEQWEEALSLARQAVAPSSAVDSSNAKIAKGLPKSLRLWDLLLDLEESLGTVATTKDSYNRAMEIKVATPMHILNFCSFLRDQKYFEESFSAYERAVELFQFPAAKVLWMAYLQNFIERYQGTKVERVRDLFERCYESCPPEDVSEFYLLNGEFEEKYGLTKRALSVYKAMCQKVPTAEKSTAYQLYIAKTIKYLGVTATRDVYQEAISALDDEATAKLCLDFAKMESSLQEIDRARSILVYGAQLADPRRNPEYWGTWHDFEVANGNEETFREMLRIKRSVQASFSTVNYNATDVAGSLDNLNPEEALELIADQEGVDLDDDTNLRKQLAPIHGFVQQQHKRPAAVAGLEDIENRVAKLRKAAENDEEIDIDDSDDDNNENDSGVNGLPAAEVRDVSLKQVPTAVFGGLAPNSTTDLK